MPGEDVPPPAKKAKRTAAPKKDTAKNKSKSGTAKNSSDTSRVAATPAADVKKEPPEVDEHGVEKGAMGDYLPKDELGMVSFVSELVLSEADVRNETKKTTETMRRVFTDGDLTMPSVLSRTKDGSGGFSTYSFGGGGEDVDITKPDVVSVMDKKLLHDAKAQEIFQQVLSPLTMNYTKEALTALSDGIQSHFRTILESSIAAHLKRTNRKAMEHFCQMEKILSSTVNASPSSLTSPALSFSSGDVKPDNIASYALLFGPDESARVASECSEMKQKFSIHRTALEGSMKELLQQADESLKRGQRKLVKAVPEKRAETGGGGGTDSSQGGSNGAVANSNDDSVPWWIKEVSR